ncbi:MAG: leucyl/phenylalanyl-tRNA--protein transferase [Acidimicrobiia bacterium]
MQAPDPAPVGPSRWLLPDPSAADADGLVGLGADLEPETLVDAYRRGVFPWPHGRMALPWFSPDPRAVLRPAAVHVSRSLRQTLRRSGWTSTVDAAFDDVIAACADRPRAEGTWIDRRMRAAYGRLQRLGWAHSLEVWDGSRLVGGLYGVRVGACFTGESMFSRVSDASKAALVDLCRRWGDAGGAMVDVQLPTGHLASMGAVEVARAAFLAELADVRGRVVRMATDRLPVSRLAPAAPPPSPAPRPGRPAGP